MSEKEYADWSGERMADRLRHITAENGHEAVSPRADVDPAVIELLRPLVARAIDTGERVDIPAGCWIRAEEREIATLAVEIGHADTGADVQVSMAVSRGPSHELPVLRVRAGAKALRQIATELGDLDKCIAWAYLELWEQAHRGGGKTVLSAPASTWGKVNTCTKCEQTKDLTRFYPRPRRIKSLTALIL